MKPTKKQLEALWKVCSEFVTEQKIHCAETIMQCDWVIENAYEFIENVCDVVGYASDEHSEGER